MMTVLTWFRRLVVSFGIGGISYLLMLGIMVLSVVFDREFEPVITFAFNTGRLLTNWLDSLVSGVGPSAGVQITLKSGYLIPHRYHSLFSLSLAEILGPPV